MMRLAIVDNQHIFREGLQRLIEAENDIEVLASTSELSSLTNEQIEEVDLFLVDIDVIRSEHQLIDQEILSQELDQKIIALSSETEKEDVKEAVLAGCHGFLLKEMSYPKFIKAIRKVIEEGGFIHPHALQHIIEEYRELASGINFASKIKAKEMLDDRVCTHRESEILQLLVNGNDNSNIAKELSISEKTVKNHLTNIFRKLNVKDRTQAAVIAIRNQWVNI